MVIFLDLVLLYSYSLYSCIAILLHDIGHGPFSHTLEKSIVNHINHETLSLLFMEELNRQFKGKLTLAIQIFKDEYKKKFCSVIFILVVCLLYSLFKLSSTFLDI